MEYCTHQEPWVRPSDLFNYWPLVAAAQRLVPLRLCGYSLKNSRASADEMIFAATHVAADRLGMRVAVVSGDWDLSTMDGRGGRVRVFDLACAPRPVRFEDQLRWAGMFGKPFANIPPAPLPPDVVKKIGREDNPEDPDVDKDAPEYHVWKRLAAMHQLLLQSGGMDAVARTAVNLVLVNMSPYVPGCLIPAGLLEEMETQARGELTR